jgi:NADP-dependent aldehyde dehydrogenase
MTLPQGYNYIGGRRSANGTLQLQLQSFDASSGEPLPGTFFQASEAEVDAAAKAAATAYPVYRNLSAEKRASFLAAIADEIDARR